LSFNFKTQRYYTSELLELYLTSYH